MAATVSRATYFRTAAALLVLLGLTAGAAYLPVGNAAHTALALGIAAAKAALIALFFMHVRVSGPLVRVFAGAGLLWLLLLLGLTASDYATRGPEEAAGGLHARAEQLQP